MRHHFVGLHPVWQVLSLLVLSSLLAAQDPAPQPAAPAPKPVETQSPPPSATKGPSASAGTESTAAPPLAGSTKQGDYTDKVVVIPIGEEDLMNPARFEFMSRTMTRATEQGAKAVVFNLNTPGGLAWNTSTVVMEDMKKLGCRSIAYVNPRAMSAGALVALATDVIYMSPVSSIGAATPISMGPEEIDEHKRAKLNSGFMAMARSAAKAKGHNPDVVDSMIDKDVGLKVGNTEIVPKGKICTLDQQQATTVYDGKPLLAKAIARDIAEVLKQEGLPNDTVTAEPKGFEMVAIWITQYAAILLLIGIAAGYIEMQHPGFGVPGIISVIAFALFFFGHAVAGSLVGYETVFIFLVGVVLIIVELFIFPGHLIPGLLGLLCVFGALIYTMAGWDIYVPEGKAFPVRFSAYTAALQNLGIAFVGAVAIIILFMRFFPTTGPFKFLVLRTKVAGEQAAIEGEGQREISHVQVGASGVTRSAMRPYGHVDFEGRLLEAMVEGDYLAPGASVRVRAIRGGRIIVERA